MLNRTTVLWFMGAAMSLQAATLTFNSSASLPPVGLASSETAQVNVVNTAVSTTTTSPSCTGTITFYNASGTPIGNPAAFTVGSRQIFSVTLPYSSAGATAARTVIRAEINLMSISAGLTPPPACSLASSLETFDTATGVTHTLASGVPITGGVFAVVSPVTPPVVAR